MGSFVEEEVDGLLVAHQIDDGRVVVHRQEEVEHDGVGSAGPLTADRDRSAGRDEVQPGQPEGPREGNHACASRIRRQAASGSWTRSRQWETQRALFRSARATVGPPAQVNGVWPSNDAWLRAAL